MQAQQRPALYSTDQNSQAKVFIGKPIPRPNRLLSKDRQFALELSLNAARWAAANGATALTQIKVPIQIIQATTVDAARTRVPLAPGKAAAWAASVSTLLPQAELRVISTASHFVMIEAAEDTTLMIREFVGRLTLGS